MYNSRKDMSYTRVAVHINIAGIPLTRIQLAQIHELYASYEMLYRL